MTFSDLSARAQRFLDTSPGDIPRWWLWFAAIVAIGTLLRFWNLSGADIWMDEAVTLGFARLDLWTILTGNIDNHPPLTWAIQHIWHSITPDPAYARVPAATFGSASVAIIMLAMRDMASPRAAIFSGLLLAFSTAHIYYSQDARMYPYLIFGLLLAAWGGLGHVRPSRHSARAYALLYVIGGAIAIYSHALGLVVMALIGFGSLAGGVMGPERNRFIRDWFIRNIALFVITLPWLLAIPAASSTFPGIAGDNSLTDIQWFYRNATGFPGIGAVAIIPEAIFYGLAALAVPIAWLSGRRALSITLIGLIAVFPLIVLAMHIANPVMANKTLLPGIIGVCIGAGYGLSRLSPRWLSSALGAFIVLAALGSALNERAHHIKSEDYTGAYEYAREHGFGDASAITCIHFHAAAAWENRRDGQTLYYRRGDVIDYHGPEYWQAARNTMNWLRAADADEIDEALGGGWLIEGGLGAALEGQNQTMFIRPTCPAGKEDEITAALIDLGFTPRETHLVRGNASDELILEAPLTRITLFERETGQP